MTTPPPAPLPAPSPAPAGPPKKTPSGVVALVFGIILSFIGLVYGGLRFLLTLVALVIQPDAYVLGQVIGTLIFVAAFGVPGILLSVGSPASAGRNEKPSRQQSGSSSTRPSTMMTTMCLRLHRP